MQLRFISQKLNKIQLAEMKVARSEVCFCLSDLK